jgi:hypothetical protein
MDPGITQNGAAVRGGVDDATPTATSSGVPVPAGNRVRVLQDLTQSGADDEPSQPVISRYTERGHQRLPT